MKSVVTFLTLLFTVIFASAQYSDQANSGTIKAGAGYAKDFPGLAGSAIQAEYTRGLNSFLEAGIGMKFSNMSGYPRTNSVKEYTKAYSLDFNLFFLPLNSEKQKLRIGGGYSFSFYNIRRTYPVFESGAIEKVPTWPSHDKKGRIGGLTAIAEYQYSISNAYSLGMRVSCYKAYDQVLYVGPFVAINL
jgi:hypothetical protein